MIKINRNTFMDLTTELCKLYFPHLKYLMDDPKGNKVKYAIECFSNGVLTYERLITALSKNCHETQDVMHELVSKHIEDFGDYKFKPKQNAQFK